MKKITFSIVVAGLLLLMGALTYSSCNKEETATGTEPVTLPMVTKAGGTVLGYLDESNAFKPIANSRLLDFYRTILHLSPDFGLGEPQIVAEGSVQPYVKVRSIDGTLRISTGLTPYGGGLYIMNGGGGSVTCTCTTVDCSSSSGCDSKLDGGNCTCSPCVNGGECKKSSSTTSNMAIRAFFGA